MCVILVTSVKEGFMGFFSWFFGFDDDKDDKDEVVKKDKFEGWTDEQFDKEYSKIYDLYYSFEYEKCYNEGIDLYFSHHFDNTKWQKYLRDFMLDSCRQVRNKNINDAEKNLEFYAEGWYSSDRYWKYYEECRHKAIEFTYNLIELEHEDEDNLDRYYSEYNSYWKWKRYLDKEKHLLVDGIDDDSLIF